MARIIHSCSNSIECLQDLGKKEFWQENKGSKIKPFNNHKSNLEHLFVATSKTSSLLFTKRYSVKKKKSISK